MLSRIVCTLITWLALCELSSGQEIQRGTLKKLDVAAKQITVEIGGQQRDFSLSDETQVLDATGNTLAEKLKDFSPGKEIFVRPEKRGDREVLTGIRLVNTGGNQPNPAPQGGQRPGIQQGVIKQIDADKLQVTITSEGKDIEATVTAETQFRSEGNTPAERLAKFSKDQRVMFVTQSSDGKLVLRGLAPAQGAPQGRPANPGERTSPEHANLKPLAELGTEKYQGFVGGLYLEGLSKRPDAHEQAGVRIAKQIQPLNAEGKPDANGKIVLMSVGMSNTSQSSDGFRRWLNEHRDQVNPQVQFVNGAQGGMTAQAIQSAESQSGDRYWSEVDNRLKQAGLTREQVQVIWIKQADAGPSEGFPSYAKKLQGELQKIVQLIAGRFPNCKQVYLSSRTYGGYATTRLNPEPYAYESGFAVKWLIDDQINGSRELNYDPSKGDVKAPWLSWGAYLWANGAIKRADGFSYEASDFSGDGTHHSPAGSEKVGRLMGEHFLSDLTTKGWFAKP